MSVWKEVMLQAVIPVNLVLVMVLLQLRSGALSFCLIQESPWPALLIKAILLSSALWSVDERSWSSQGRITLFCSLGWDSDMFHILLISRSSDMGQYIGRIDEKIESNWFKINFNLNHTYYACGWYIRKNMTMMDTLAYPWSMSPSSHSLHVQST